MEKYGKTYTGLFEILRVMSEIETYQYFSNWEVNAFIKSRLPWTCISMDFVSGFHTVLSGVNSVLVVVDCFSKMARFLPCNKHITSGEIISLLDTKIFSKFKYPTTILMDYAMVFCSSEWIGVLSASRD